MNVLTELRCRIADWRMRRRMLRLLFSEEADWEPISDTRGGDGNEGSTDF